MASKFRYTATTPEGRTVTRTSERTYTHVVFALENPVAFGKHARPHYVVMGWAGNEKLAQSRANTARNQKYGVKPRTPRFATAEWHAWYAKQRKDPLYGTPYYTDVVIVPAVAG